MNTKRNFLKRAVAAATFGLFAATGVVTTQAVQAGSQAAYAAKPADAAVSVGIGIGIGGPRYYRYGWQNGAWVRLGFYNAPAPGYYPSVGYVGWAPPPHPYWFYAHPYYGHPYYGRPYYYPAWGRHPVYYGHPGWYHDRWR